jgi:hypothetical protein
MQAATVALLAIVAYASTPFNFWVADDYNYIFPKDLGRVISFFDPTLRAFYRPLNWTSWAIDYALWGKSPFGWHITSVLFHVVSALVVAWIVYRLLGSWWTALLAGGLFALFPAHTETVTWIGGRADLVCGLFYFPAVLFYVLYRRRREEGGARAGLFYGLSLLMALGALLSKEMGVTVPLALALTDLFLYPPSRVRSLRYLWSRALPLVPFFALVGAYGLMRYYIVAAGIIDNPYVGTSLLSPSVLFNAAASNVLLLAGLPVAPTWVASLPALVKALIVVTGVALAVLLARWVGKWGWFALLWTVVTLLPTANLSQMRWLYIPSFGVCLLGALVCHRLLEGKASYLRDKGGAAYVVPVLLLVFWGSGTLYLNAVWHHSGEEARSILNQIQGYVPAGVEPVTIYFAGAPSYYGSVLLFNTGLPSAMSLVYGDRKIELHEVEQPLPDPVIQAALANPPVLKPNPLFLGYKDGVVTRYPSIESLMQAGLRKE